MLNNSGSSKKAVITGGGPSGLFCAYCLVKNRIAVDLYEQKDQPGRKYILAGQSGLNITNSENPDLFASRYGKDKAFFRKLLTLFSPSDLVKWYNAIGIKTFTGSSGRVFAETEGSGEILDKWLSILYGTGLFKLYTNHRLTDIRPDRTLVFESCGETIEVKTASAVFALGGASWPGTGSDGRWVDIFKKAGADIVPLKAANCGFEKKWSGTFIEKWKGRPLKNIRVDFKGKSNRGELLVTPYGIEGSGIYFSGAELRDEIIKSGRAEVYIDLLPDLTMDRVIKKLKKDQGRETLSNYLRKAVNITGIKFALLKEIFPHSSLKELIHSKPDMLKSLPLELHGMRPLEEAISTSGGVSLESLDENMMLRNYPGYYVIGEMADWEAPTGGYLLQGCFSTAYLAASGIIGNAPARDKSAFNSE
ncbi:MAG: NAD(P)-dependent oxidoreductase [Spirochaetales bacterium]|nr:NAD(P)-dependent oxidoreductase [Spirochaetales bacterium]